jgi:O-antigen/teichoic acid export membrane protein
MGVIKRQGAKTLVVNYAGAIIGGLAVLFVYSSNDEIYGYAHWLFSTATLLMPVASLGVHALIIKFYPAYSQTDKERFNGFLSLIIGLLVAAFLMFLLCWKLLSVHFYSYLRTEAMNYEIFKSYENYVLILVFLFVALKFLSNQSANKLRITIPNLIQQFGYKLFLPTLILLYAYYDWTIHRFSWGMILFFAASTLLLIFYVYRLGGLRFAGIKRPYPQFSYIEMLKFSIYSIFNQIGSSLAMRIDSVMIPIILGSTTSNSYYVKAFFIANFVEMPTRSLNQIASPILSKAWTDNNLEQIKSIYKKASQNLFAIGLYIFLGLWFCIDDLVKLSSDPESFPHIRMIFLFVGSAKLIDMLTSVNSYIIGYSRLYRYNLFFIVFLGLMNLFLNIKWIGDFGITGAAMASATSLFLFNLIKLLFIWKNFEMLPFTMSNLKATILASAIFSLYFITDFNFHPLINILLKASLVSFLYLPIAYFWKLSPDINNSIRNYIKKLRQWN